MTRNPIIDTSSFSPVGEQTREAIARIAESDCPVLILGEHGVGKRSTAEQIHALSPRRRTAYREIRCGDFDADTLLPILSTCGTLYLSEVSTLSLPFQDLLVNFYFRSQHSQACRILFGSSREPFDDVRSLRMNEEFYYLISTVTLRIPPLRCRRYEIPGIADQLMTHYAKQFDRPKPVLCKEVMEYLKEHSWPGNLFELQTAIKTFVAIEDQAISFAALRATAPSQRLRTNHAPLSLKDATRAASTQIERQLISEVLAATGGNRKRAADELGISYKALLYKIKQIETTPHSTYGKTGVLI